MMTDSTLVSKSENYADFRYAGGSLQYSRKCSISLALGQQICLEALDSAEPVGDQLFSDRLTVRPGLGLSAAVGRVPSWLHLALVDSVPRARCFH